MMKISDLDLLELDNLELEKTEFYKAYSSMPFNKGVIFKRIGAYSNFVFSEVISSLNKEINEVTIQNINNVEKIRANVQIHDFIYELLTHKDIFKKWRYNDDAFFTEFSIEFNSQESFRKIGLYDIDTEEFIKRLFCLSVVGSCYGRMNYDEQQIKSIIQDFVNQLLNVPGNRIVVSTQPWSGYLIGWFECFFIIRKNDLIILGQDDYD
ncbi:hypothetical protein [Flavobacterium gelatinilyticum]|uniref:hypothetical protein n=1 Tax=Flavobacterium gelatinilyticum TaxID=3003260 RepID=UPI00247FA70A|nr:hypothetical protein [Flavobacterium gelatinilyticum]